MSIYRIVTRNIPAWFEIAVMVILGIHIALFLSRVVILPMNREYMWYVLLNGYYDRLLLLAVIISMIMLWIKRQYGPPSLLTWYVPFYAGMIWYIAAMSSDAAWALPLERDPFRSASIFLQITGHACASAAGLLAVVWIWYARVRQEERKNHLTVLMQRLMGLVIPFLIMGMLCSWVWTFRTQGLLCQIDRDMLLNGIIVFMYLLYRNLRHMRHVFGIGTVILSLNGAIAVMLLYAGKR